MSQILFKCLNNSCNNELSEFDIKRLDVKFSWQRFCINCRRYKQRIIFINCQDCNKKISFVTNTHNVAKIYCKDCGDERHRRRSQ